MATANFNTQILSSNYEKESRNYNLDEVITKDFSGPYTYSFADDVPGGVDIDRNTLRIPEKLTFVLSVTVNAGDKNNPISVIATTNVTVDTTKDYAKEVQILLDNPNVTQKIVDTQNNWSSIISGGQIG